MHACKGSVHLTVRFCSLAADRALETLLYPIDLLSGRKYVEAEERALAIERKKRAQPGGTLAISGASQDGGPGESSHLRHAKANSGRSIYYSSIDDEAKRCAKMKKDWRDPDFPPEMASIVCGDGAVAVPAAASSFSRHVRNAAVSWEQPRYFCSGQRTRGLGLGRGAQPEPAAWFISDWGTWDLSVLLRASSGKGEAVPSGRGGGRGGKAAKADGYVASAVVAMLQADPSLCDNLLDLTHIAQGICGVALYKHRAVGAGAGARGPVMVYVDTHFPCSAGSLWFGARPGYPVRDAWAAAVEKAIAKTYGSYEAISGVRGMCLAVDALTGSTVDTEDLEAVRVEGGRVPVGAGAATAGYTSAETALWKRLASAVSGVNVVFCGSRSILDEQVCVCFVGSWRRRGVRGRARRGGYQWIGRWLLGARGWCVTPRRYWC